MNSINKHKFLTELGRLLTFMYEEDRQTALDMYGRMFDDAKDEQALVHFLVSPTRQAVVLARTYNAKERKLQVHAQPKSVLEGEEPEALPEFILAIDQIQQEATEAQGGEAQSQVPPDQFSFFADNIHPQATVVPDIDTKKTEHPTEDAVPPAATTPPAEQPAEPEKEPADKVDAFVEDFSIKDDSLFPDTDEPVKHKDEQTEPTSLLQPVRKPKVFLLILYIILAIPLSLIGVALLLVPTLLFLALAGAAIIAGSLVLAAAFSGFAVFADVVVVLGSALIVLALGLLLLWTFVWFIGVPIVGFINSVIRLGGKWCYKEVLAE